MSASGAPGPTEQESSQHRQARVHEIVARLRAEYPDARTSLTFHTPLELLVATVLSAQSTDVRVNQVTSELFVKYPTARAYAETPLDELEQDIRPVGFYHTKAKYLRDLAQQLVNRSDGKVPRTMDELISLPGIGRKTANVVLGNAYGIVEGIVVDTHVTRVSQRLGLTTEQDPAKIEQDLMTLVPREVWLDFSNLLIYHGRAVCQARLPHCEECVLLDLCPTGRVRVPLTAAHTRHDR
jgi:endonuclease III